jgi:hypothetical protein
MTVRSDLPPPFSRLTARQTRLFLTWTGSLSQKAPPYAGIALFPAPRFRVLFSTDLKIELYRLALFRGVT